MKNTKKVHKFLGTVVILFAFLVMGIINNAKLYFGQVEINVQNRRGNPVEHVSIEIIDTNLKVVDLITTDESGKAVVKLSEGKYSYKLAVVPEDYQIDTNWMSFEVTSGSSQIRKITLADKKGTFKIEITSSSSKNRIAGQLISIYDLNDNHITKITTDAHGKVQEELPVGKYYYKLNMPIFKSKYAQKHIAFEVIEGEVTLIELDLDR